MKVINLISGPGSGKSVLASQLFSQMKIDGYHIELVQEYAKYLVLTGKTDVLNNQYFVSQKQHQLISSLEGNVDYVVTDSSLIHGLAYNILNKQNTSDLRKTHEAIIEWLEEHENVFIFVERGNIPYQQEGRLESISEARDVDALLRVLMNREKITYKTVYTDDGFDVVYEEIKQQLGE